MSFSRLNRREKMLNRNTNNQWEKFGKTNAYFGVVTHKEYHIDNLTEDSKKIFFQSGYTYIDQVLDNIKRYIDSDFKPVRALDFGCGVGRLVMPLSEVANHVTGMDISDSMLNEAQKNCEERNIKNVLFVKSDDTLSQLEGKYDFIHSYIVLQHIPVNRGETIFKNLIQYLDDNGVGVIHFTYLRLNKLSTEYIRYIILKYMPLARIINNFIKGKDIYSPFMERNEYDLNLLISEIHKIGVKSCHIDFTKQGHYLGATLYFKKSV